MTWHFTRGAWRPSLQREEGVWTPEGVVDELERALRCPLDFRAFTLCAEPEAEPERWADKLRIPAGTYREFALAARDAARTGSRFAADFAASWASDACTIGDSVQDTSFQFTAGQQRFLAMVRQLVAETDRDDLRRSLLEAWAYEDPGPSLRWDPLDESRQYALQWYDPTNTARNPPVTMRGANRLAVEALPLFPSVPIGRRLRTVGFSTVRRRDLFTWPLWSGWLTVDVIASLLSHSALQESEPDRSKLAPLGVVDIFRSAVVMPSGRYRSFAPAESS